jgi:hypothetical protein
MSDRIKCSVIDLVGKRRLTAELQSKDNEDVDLQETLKTLSDYLKAKLSRANADKDKDDPVGNTIRNEVLPVVSAATIVALEELLGEEMTGFILSDRLMKTVMVRLTLLGYALHSLVQQNEFVIQTHSVPVTDQEIEQVVRLEDLSDLITKAAAQGIDPKVAVAELIKRELITADDLRSYGLGEDVISSLESYMGRKSPASDGGGMVN